MRVTTKTTCRTAFACALIATVMSVASMAHAKTFGLVIGINDYQHLDKLNGAVDDARDIHDALMASGAEDVTLLLDADATRDAILKAWSDILSKAGDGDTVVFSYAGHGGQERERVAGSEEDGLDEVFLLAGFKEDASGNAQRIIDDELNRMFTAARHLKVVFVADSCHSGTMTRSFDARAGRAKTRLGTYGEIVDDQLPPPDPQTATLDTEVMENVVFFGAVQDHEVVLEFPIGGKPRGALSWSFARALRGHADQDGDRVVNTRELERYLVEKVRTMSEGRQFPQMVPRGRPTEVTFAVPTDQQNAGSANQPAASDPTSDALRLAIIGAENSQALFARLRDATAAPEDKADLVWDTQGGEVIASSGDIVARPGPGTDTGQMQALVDKWLLLRDLGVHAEKRPLSLRIDAGNATHRAGAQLEILLTGHKHENLTLFNLAVDGTIQFLVPWPASANKAYHGKVRPDTTFRFALQVSEPFGADHLVALTSPEPMAELHRDLTSLDGKKAAGHLRSIIAAHLHGASMQLGSVGLFTAP